MVNNYVLADGDDWQGLYLNGNLVDEGHRLQLEEVCGYMVVDNPTSFEKRNVNLGWLNEVGLLPPNIDDVVFEEE